MGRGPIVTVRNVHHRRGFPVSMRPGRLSRCNYISNASREDVIVLLKEQLARFEGQAEVSGTA